MQRRIRFFQIYEHNLTYYTLQRLQEGDLYVDIGANIGYYTLLASRRVGKSGKVICVEADPISFEALTKNLELNGCRNVSAYNVAATMTKCRVTIQRTDLRNSGCNSVAIGVGPNSVEGLPFADIVGGDLGRIRFIKIDIEGSETPILRAILGLLSQLSQNLIIASEISTSSAEYVGHFVAAGFRAYAIQNIYRIDYYLIRSYLRKYGESNDVHTIPVQGYDPNYSDYVFERVPTFD
ncbi:MAG: FkbM family methyltransferase [Bryobacteraceae bacterium]